MGATGATARRSIALIKIGALERREEQVWRDSLRDYDFVPDSAPQTDARSAEGMGCIGPALRQASRRASCCMA